MSVPADWLATVLIAKRIHRAVRGMIGQSIAKGKPISLSHVTAATVARYGARFGEDNVRDAARSAFLGYRPGRARIVRALT